MRGGRGGEFVVPGGATGQASSARYESQNNVIT